VENYTPAYPVLTELPRNVKIGADNPDNLYMQVGGGGGTALAGSEEAGKRHQCMGGRHNPGGKQARHPRAPFLAAAAAAGLRLWPGAMST
jgi:hypothetical protein